MKKLYCDSETPYKINDDITKEIKQIAKDTGKYYELIDKINNILFNEISHSKTDNKIYLGNATKKVIESVCLYFKETNKEDDIFKNIKINFEKE